MKLTGKIFPVKMELSGILKRRNRLDWVNVSEGMDRRVAPGWEPLDQLLSVSQEGHCAVKLDKLMHHFAHYV
jgi:hypothetical protein